MPFDPCSLSVTELVAHFRAKRLSPVEATQAFSNSRRMQVYRKCRGRDDGYLSPTLVEAILDGHVMAQSDATGWARHVEAGTFRLLVTFGEQRTKWNAPTAKELGIDIVSYSPYGIVAPKGMDPKLTRQLHDAFRKTLDDPEHLKVLQQFDQVYWYKSSEDYAKWAAATFAEERATIERLGLLAK